MNEKTVKLYLGCGPLPIHPQHLQTVDNTWTFTDKYVKDPKIKNIDACDLSDYDDESVDEIYHSHLWEHLSYTESEQAVSEWFRVLKPGGVMTVNVPDMLWLARELISVSEGNKPVSRVFNTEQKLMEVIYGNQDHEGEFHKTGFTPSILSMILTKAGFVNIRVDRGYDAHDMGVLLATAYKEVNHVR